MRVDGPRFSNARRAEKAVAPGAPDMRGSDFSVRYAAYIHPSNADAGEERGLAGLSDLDGIHWTMPMGQFFEAWGETIVRNVAQRTGGFRSGSCFGHGSAMPLQPIATPVECGSAGFPTVGEGGELLVQA